MQSTVWTRCHRKRVAHCVEPLHGPDLSDAAHLQTDLSRTRGSGGLQGLKGLELNVELIESRVRVCVCMNMYDCEKQLCCLQMK